jgi:cysteinyl-tRNA synthetase
MLYDEEPTFPFNKNLTEEKQAQGKPPKENPEETSNANKPSIEKLERELRKLQKERTEYEHSIKAQEERLKKLVDVKTEMAEDFNSSNKTSIPQNLKEEVNKIEKEIREKIIELRGQESKLTSRIMPLEIEIEARKKGTEKKEKEQIFLEKLRKI